MPAGGGRYAAQQIATGPWTPAAIAGLVGWYDASDTATITASGGNVSQWNDKSSQADHLTQGTGAAQPNTGTDTVNGLNVVAFSGGDSIANLTFSTVAANACTVFVVAENTFSGNVQGATLYLRDAGSNLIMGLTHYYSNKCAVSNDYIGVTPPTTASVLGTHCITVKWDTSSTIYIDGVSDTVGNVDSANTASRISMATGDQILNMCEAIVYNSALNDTDRVNVETYLKAKWGIP